MGAMTIVPRLIAYTADAIGGAQRQGPVLMSASVRMHSGWQTHVMHKVRMVHKVRNKLLKLQGVCLL